MVTKATGSGRGAGVSRAFAILNELLAGKEHDRGTVSDRWGVSLTTATRDLKAVAQVHGVVAERRGARTVYRMKSDLDAASRSAVIALCLGLSLSGVFKGSRYAREVRNGLKGIMKRVAPGNELRDLERKILVLRRGGEATLPAQPNAISELIDATLRSHWILIDYQRFDGRQEKIRVAPLSLAIYDHQLYLIGRSEKHPWAPYRVSRVASVQKEDETFKYPHPSEYDPIETFTDRFGIFLSADYPVEDVDIKLSGHWRVFAKTHQWHPSQQTTASGDHTLLRLRVRVCPEVEAWILGFGEHAEVVAPASLRERITQRIARIATNYALAADAAEAT